MLSLMAFGAIASVFGDEDDNAETRRANVTVSTSPSPPSSGLTSKSDALEQSPALLTALLAIARLEVKGRAPKTGFSRNAFGQRWADLDGNGCDQRNDVLRRDLSGVVAKPGTHGCVVLHGIFSDPYSNETIVFDRGQEASSNVQIDHVVALADAWQKGAQQWDGKRRSAFANDPLNLLASKGSVNQAKGAGDTATWLPPNEAFRCRYVARQVAVKRAYGLWVTAAERDAMVRVLSACPNEPLPEGGLLAKHGTGGALVGASRDFPRRTPSAEPESRRPKSRPVREAPRNVDFANCSEARAAGAAPIMVGEPGYARKLDRDGDGIACE